MVEEDVGLFGEFAAGGVGEGFAGVSAAAGQLPPVVIGLVGVFASGALAVAGVEVSAVRSV